MRTRLALTLTTALKRAAGRNVIHDVALLVAALQFVVAEAAEREKNVGIPCCAKRDILRDLVVSYDV